jgi:hypothetical protein
MTTDQTETRLPWGQDTITIKGRNAGVEALTVHFDDEHLNIIDFLNNSLNAEYAALYETIMSKYESRLKFGSLFDHAFPETAFTAQKIAPSQSTSALPTADKELIEALFKEYHTYLDDIKTHFKAYEITIKKWFNELPEDERQ